jgi:acyl-CoA thioesterase
MFALADVGFALAANCYGQMALALECSINYFRPVKPGTRLVAKVEEVFRGRRTGSYIARIEDDRGRLVCMFKSTSFQIDDQKSVIETGGQEQ